MDQGPPAPGHELARPAPPDLFLSIETPASNRHIGPAIKRIQERQGLLDRSRQVNIAEENGVELGLQHAPLDRLSLAPVDLVAKIANIRELPHRRLGVIRRTIIDDDQLVTVKLLPAETGDTGKRVWQTPRLVVRGKYYRELSHECFLSNALSGRPGPSGPGGIITADALEHRQRTAPIKRRWQRASLFNPPVKNAAGT